MRPVDLRSDTVTRPSEGMRQAMACAEVGDDVYGEDPTVNALQERVAQLTGHPAALFVPSGTMANQIAIAVHTRPGDEVIMADIAHPFHYEAGGAAAISGVQLRLVPTISGRMRADDVRAAVRPDDVHHAPATLLCVEDTSNRGGGTAHRQAQLDALLDVAAECGLRTHLDGARAWNAAVALGQPLIERTQRFDSVSLCLSKGLGAPVGSILCGSVAFIHTARRVRKRLGGGMRQAGIIAAAGLYALDHNIERLADDHRRATQLADGLRQLGLLSPDPQSNLVFVQIEQAHAASEHLGQSGILTSPVGPSSLRLVTHLDIDDDGVKRTLDAFTELISERAAR